MTKKGVPLLHTSTRTDEVAAVPGPRPGQGPVARRGPPGAARLGIADADGRVKPSRQAKSARSRSSSGCSPGLVEAVGRDGCSPTADAPLRVVDLGCGNAYLTLRRRTAT